MPRHFREFDIEDHLAYGRRATSGQREWSDEAKEWWKNADPQSTIDWDGIISRRPLDEHEKIIHYLMQADGARRLQQMRDLAEREAQEEREST